MDPSVESDVRRVRHILRSIEAAENAGDSRAIVDLLAEDVVFMVPDEPVQEGKPACAEFVTRTMACLWEQFDRRITYESAEVQIWREYALDRGTFSFTVSPRTGGAVSSATGKYLLLYRRGPEGDWRLARAIVSLDGQPEPPEPAHNC